MSPTGVCDTEYRYRCPICQLPFICLCRIKNTKHSDQPMLNGMKLVGTALAPSYLRYRYFILGKCDSSELLYSKPSWRIRVLLTTNVRRDLLESVFRFRIGYGLDPDSISSLDPESESGSRRAKMTHKSRKNL